MAHRADRLHLASVLVVGLFFLLTACGSGLQMTTGPSAAQTVIDTCADGDIRIERVMGSIDGVVILDSASNAIQVTRAIDLRFAGVAPGAHFARVEAFGRARDYSGILFRGSAEMDIGADGDTPQPIALDWAGPGAYPGKFNVTLGRVGKVRINAIFPETTCD